MVYFMSKISQNCKCFAKTVFISTVSNNSSGSESIKIDLQVDIENFREIFINASPTNKHFQYHNIDPYELLSMKFHISLDSSAKVNFLSLFMRGRGVDQTVFN